MLLAVDVGNTQTVLGLFDGEQLVEHWRVATEAERTGDELAALFADLLELRGRCVRRRGRRLPLLHRPPARPRLPGAGGAAHRRAAARPRPGHADRASRSSTTTHARSARTGSRTRSRRASATARRASWSTSAPRRTSTPSRPTGEYVGGVLAPGIEISMDALFARAARLTKVDFVEPEAVIGKTTVASLQSGLVYGFAGQVDGIVERMRSELGDAAPGDCDRRPRRPDRSARADDREGRPATDSRRPQARLGPQPLSASGRRRRPGRGSPSRAGWPRTLRSRAGARRRCGRRRSEGSAACSFTQRRSISW